MTYKVIIIALFILFVVALIVNATLYRQHKIDNWFYPAVIALITTIVAISLIIKITIKP